MTIAYFLLLVLVGITSGQHHLSSSRNCYNNNQCHQGHYCSYVSGPGLGVCLIIGQKMGQMGPRVGQVMGQGMGQFGSWCSYNSQCMSNYCYMGRCSQGGYANRGYRPAYPGYNQNYPNNRNYPYNQYPYNQYPYNQNYLNYKTHN